LRCLVSALLVLVTSALAGGCNASTRGLTWEVAFESARLRDRTVALEAEIRTGGCTGTALYGVVFPIGVPPSTMGPPSLGPGRYGSTSRGGTRTA
jgi:hypothetical protein